MAGRIDLGQLADRPKYQATVIADLEKDLAAQRHMRFILFYLIVILSTGFLFVIITVSFGWVSATQGMQVWSQKVLETAILPFFGGAVGFSLGRLTGLKSS